MNKYPKIQQFRSVVKYVREKHDFQGLNGIDEPILQHLSPYPVINYTGTVKLHGTNASISFFDGVKCFSRTREISINDDNCGFARFVSNLPDDVIDRLSDGVTQVYGEWCGEGIQKGCAIHRLPKRFMIFNVLVSGGFRDVKYYYGNTLLNKSGIYSVNQFETFKCAIDFNYPERAQKRFVEVVQKVEKQCPVAHFFGVDGIGEGVVWKPDLFSDTKMWFKTKGEKHSSSHVKIVTDVDLEKAKDIESFAEKTVTKNRLDQGLTVLSETGKPIDMSSTGDYLRWVYNDIIEEDGDILKASGLDKKEVGKAISKRARGFWFSKVQRV